MYTQLLKCEEAAKYKIKIVPVLSWSLAQVLSRAASQPKLLCNSQIVTDSADFFCPDKASLNL